MSYGEVWPHEIMRTGAAPDVRACYHDFRWPWGQTYPWVPERQIVVGDLPPWTPSVTPVPSVSVDLKTAVAALRLRAEELRRDLAEVDAKRDELERIERALKAAE